MQLGPAKQTEQGFNSMTWFDVVEFSFPWPDFFMGKLQQGRSAREI